MNKHEDDRVIRDWARLGCLIGAETARAIPDLERLLLRTAEALPREARLLPLVVTWLTVYGNAIAGLRLARLIRDELAPEDQPALGLLLESAIAHGAPAGLRRCVAACGSRKEPRPLYLTHRDGGPLSGIAEKHASPLSVRWGLWAPEVALKPDAIRPALWTLARNPSLRDRIIRKGDLRVSILESLRWDAPDGSAPSELAVARLTGATRAAVRSALSALSLEGAITVGEEPTNERDHPVRLIAA